MPTHYTTCLYIHGLHSSVHPGKRSILEKYFQKVIAFDVDYGVETDIYVRFKDLCREEKVDFIVGSSFGGYLGFNLCAELGLPSILFNPALLFGQEDQTYVKAPSESPVPYSLFVVGEQDTVVPPSSILEYMKENPHQTSIRIMKCSWLAHRVDLETFDAAIAAGLAMVRQ